jgi:hypothetical protein
MSLHGSSQLPFLSDGVDGCFRKNGVSELTSGAASEVRRFSQLGRLKKQPQLGNFSYEPPFSYKLHIDFKNSFTKTYYRYQIWWNRKQGNGKEQHSGRHTCPEQHSGQTWRISRKCSLSEHRPRPACQRRCWIRRFTALDAIILLASCTNS